jgi:hypothetical protein
MSLHSPLTKLKSSRQLLRDTSHAHISALRSVSRCMRFGPHMSNAFLSIAQTC